MSDIKDLESGHQLIENVPTTKPKVLYLEGLRGVAALLVAFSHVSQTKEYFPYESPLMDQEFNYHHQSRVWQLLYNGHVGN